jgi:hypothetical protein
VNVLSERAGEAIVTGCFDGVTQPVANVAGESARTERRQRISRSGSCFIAAALSACG